MGVFFCVATRIFRETFVTYAAKGRRGRNHLDIATNSTDEISKNVQLRKGARMRAFSNLYFFEYFIVEFVAVSLGYGGVCVM